MQHRPHVDIGVADFLVEGLGITRTKNIKNTVRDVRGSILRVGNRNCRGRDLSANHPCKMIRKKARLRSVATPQVNQRELWVYMVLEQHQILLGRMRGIGIPKYFARCAGHGTPVTLPGGQITIH